MDRDFIKKVKYYKNPYGNGGTALKIANKLERINLKIFYLRVLMI